MIAYNVHRLCDVTDFEAQMFHRNSSPRHIAKPPPMFTFSINSVIKGSNKIEGTKGGARPKNRMGLEAPTT